MKSLAECITLNPKENFKNWYILKRLEIKKLIDIEYDQPTEENFKVIYVQDEEKQIATIEDIKFFDPENEDFDFYIGDEGAWFMRNYAPKEVVEFLDKALNKAQYEKKE